jgi:oligopeptide transport system substrate-binding protein
LKKIIYISLVLILIFASIVNGCGASSTSPSAATTSTSSAAAASGNGILTITNTDPYTLDPATSNEVLSASYIMQIFSGLLKLDNNLEPVPDIAESMPTLSSDGLSYTFHLRKDVKFQDGTAVTATDFKYSWERAANPATNSPTAATYLGDIVGVNDMLAGKANQISGVKVIDNYTLQVTIDSPKSYFLYKLTYPSSFIVEKKNVNSGANWWLKPSGTGPFKVQEWVKNTDFILARNDLYYGDKAKIAQVKMILNSTSSDMDLFETGQIDIANPGAIYSDKIMDPAEPFYQNLSITPDLSLEYIGFNCKQAPFNDANIRKAFSLAINKDTIISLIYRNMAQKADGILPTGLPGYNNNLIGLDFNINQAQALIKASKYGDISNLPPITITIGGAGGSADAITIWELM